MKQKYPSKASEAIRLYVEGNATPEIKRICKWIEDDMFFTASQAFIITGIKCSTSVLEQAWNHAKYSDESLSALEMFTYMIDYLEQRDY